MFLHFRLHCLAETERDSETFGVIFEHLDLWYPQPRGRFGLRGRNVLRGEEGGESEYPTDDESDSDDGADDGCEGSGPEENPEEIRARARLAFNAFPDRRDRERNPENEDPHETENMDVQQVMDESSRSLQRTLQILRMRYDHAVRQGRMDEARELAMEIARLEAFQSLV